MIIDKEKIVFGLWVSIALLSGCAVRKGADGESPARPIRVACIGDSITWGTAMTNRVTECYPAQLQRILGEGYDVRNFGDPGSGCYLHPPKPPAGKWGPHPWRPGSQGRAAYAFKPDIVVSNLGINDNSVYIREYIHGPDGKAEVETGLFRREYTELLKAFEDETGAPPRIILWTRLAPVGKNNGTKGKPNPFVMERDLDQVARDVGAETLDMYTPLLPYCETAHYAADGVHPEAGAQRVIAEMTARKILSMQKE